jgi:hypothetical protein
MLSQYSFLVAPSLDKENIDPATGKSSLKKTGAAPPNGRRRVPLAEIPIRNTSSMADPSRIASLRDGMLLGASTSAVAKRRIVYLR